MESRNLVVEPRQETASDLEAFRSTFPPREGSSPADIQWSAENHCYIVNGIEAAISISAVRPEPGVTNNVQEQAPASSDMSVSRKRKRTQREEEYIFKLFKFQRANEAEKSNEDKKAEETYLLEIHEKKTGDVDRYLVPVYENNGTWRVSYKDLIQGDHVVVQVLHDPTIPIFRKTYDILPEDRLRGWSKEKRSRITGKEDDFYYHRKKQFRSFTEVLTFVLYSFNVKDLTITNKRSQEVPEFDAAEEKVTVSSTTINKNSFRN